MKLLEFIKEYLVEKGPIESYQKRIQCYELIKNYNISNFLSKLKNIKPSFNKIIPSLSEINSVLHLIQKYESYPNSILEEMKELFIYYSLGYLNIEIENLKQNQFRIEEDIITIPKNEFKIILFKIKSLDYEYKKFQKEYKIYDEMLNNYIENNKKELIEKAKKEFPKEKDIFERCVIRLKDEADTIKGHLDMAFQEHNPYLRLKKIFRIYQKAFDDFIEPFPSKNEFDESDKTPIRISILTIFNVPGVISNYVYFNNYFKFISENEEDKELKDIFEKNENFKDKMKKIIYFLYHAKYFFGKEYNKKDLCNIFDSCTNKSSSDKAIAPPESQSFIGRIGRLISRFL